MANDANQPPNGAVPPDSPPPRKSTIGELYRWSTSAQDIGQVASGALRMIIAMTCVFAASGGLGVLIMSWFGENARTLSLAIPILLRGGEIFLTIAAALLVFLIILSRDGDSILTLFGVVVIAAIIIPTGDIMRMAALVGHTPSETVEAQSRGGRGEIVSFHISEAAAQRAIDRLENEPETRTVFQGMGEGQLKAMRGQLATALYGFQVEQLEVAVRQRGLDRVLLDSLDEPRVRQLSMMPANMRQARLDLVALRDMGLISLPLAEFHNLRVTGLGLEVLCRIYPTDPLVRERVTRDNAPPSQIPGAMLTSSQAPQASARDQPSLSNPNCLPVRAGQMPTREGTRLNPVSQSVQNAVTSLAPSAESGAVDIEEARRGVSRLLTVPTGGAASLRMTVPEGQSIELAIETSDARFGLDPILELSVIGEGGARRRIADDDDTAGNFNALIARALTPGTYIIEMRDFGRGGGQATLQLRLAQPVDWSRTLPLDAGTLPPEVSRGALDCPFLPPSNGLPETPLRVPSEGLVFRCVLRAGAWTFATRGIGSVQPIEFAAYLQRPAPDRPMLVSSSQPSSGDAEQRGRRGQVLTRMISYTVTGEQVTVFLRIPNPGRDGNAAEALFRVTWEEEPASRRQN